MRCELSISIVIPTCNRKVSLFRLLKSLQQSIGHILEVIIVDSGDQPITEHELKAFLPLHITYIQSQRSVCIQRNIGIKHANGLWIFLCDDDLEVPRDYLTKIVNHISSFPEVGAVTGVVLQKEEGIWTEQYPVRSSFSLLIRFIFQLSIWGCIEIEGNNFISKAVKQFYIKKGNHISKAGWPVLIDFSGEYFRTPVYGLGAAVIRKDWLINSPYDEVLDANGIGDNYGVALGFPDHIHVIKGAFVYHHQASENRISISAGYYRRSLALHYFIKTKLRAGTSTVWFVWSLVGNLISFLSAKNLIMAKATLRVLTEILSGNNPYIKGKKRNEKVVTPEL